MVEGKQRADGDILREEYKGTGAIVSALGQGAIDTKFAWLGGLTIGGTLAFFNFKKVNTAIEAAQKFSNTLRDSDNTFIKTCGKITVWLFGQGDNHVLADIKNGITIPHNAKRATEALESFVEGQRGGVIHALSSELLKIVPPLERYVKSKGSTEQFDATVMGAGFSAFLSMIGWSIIGGEHGIASSNAGKKQFKRAQVEIKELREDVELLHDKNAELRTQLKAAKDPATRRETKDETITDIVTTQEPEVLTKRKDDAHRNTHAEQHGEHVGKSHSETILAKQAAEEQAHALGA
jgi:hypothetical protein